MHHLVVRCRCVQSDCELSLSTYSLVVGCYYVMYIWLYGDTVYSLVVSSHSVQTGCEMSLCSVNPDCNVLLCTGWYSEVSL